MKHEIKLSTIKEFLEIYKSRGGYWSYIKDTIGDVFEAIAFNDIIASIVHFYPDADHHFIAHIIKSIGVAVIDDINNIDMEDNKNA